MMKTGKRILGALLALAMTASVLTGCAQPAPKDDGQNEQLPEQKTVVRVGALKGPTGMGLAKLMEDDEQGTAANDYDFTIAGAPDEIVGKFSAGELDIACLPTNVASTLYQKMNGGVRLIANNTLGMLYVLETGDEIHSVADLRGKTLYASGQGSTAEYALNYILARNGIAVGEDITVEYKSEHTELAALAASGEAELVVLPEPFVTSVLQKNADMHIALNLAEEWGKVSDSQFVMTGVIVSRDFLEANKEAVDLFLAEYKAAAEYTNSSAAEAAQLIEKFDIMTAAVAEKAIPNCNITYIAGDDMKAATEGFLSVLFEAAPASIGGALPDDAFYYTK